MTSIDTPTHPLSLKVMRVSRPEPASAWQPFYSSSPSFSAHSSASILSLQGSAPLTGHPKTLRDLTHASELLTLPATFGSIQLGETFSSCLCVNNETSIEIDDVGLKIEMQTANSKVLLAELGGRNHQLSIGGSLERVVSHEIKELGQHVLACTVVYRLPPGARAVPDASEEPGDPELQSFRKFYKFVVVNPLSVKTKVHSSRSPSALLDLSERDKVFLEIHIQNTGQQPLHFEQLQFECEENWQVEDGNGKGVDKGNKREESLFSGSLILIHPQDTRQYVYILSPKVVSLFPVTHSPGSIIPLGRLNISWRSSFGEPGRLLTSMLSRRIPPAAPQQTAPALPAYLKRTITNQHLSRPQSPLLSHSRPSTPPIQRPTSPPPAALPRPTIQTLASGIEVALLVRHIPRNEVVLEKPFTVKLALAISNAGQEGHVIRLAIQQLQPARAVPPASIEPNADDLSPRPLASGTNTPTSTVGGFNYAVAHQKLLSISRASVVDEPDKTQQRESVIESKHNQLPPPCSDTTNKHGSIAIAYVGPSTLILPEITVGAATEDGSDVDGAKSSLVQEFDLTYIPLRKGFVSFGGIRALLIEDRGISTQDGDQTPILKSSHEKRVQALREWDIVGEVWVAS